MQQQLLLLPLIVALAAATATTPDKCGTFSSCLGFTNATGWRVIEAPGLAAFPVPCDGQTPGAGSGWTVMQRRVDGSVRFQRSWAAYRAGFGDLQADYFIGLEALHRLTTHQPHELYIFMENFKNKQAYARYDNFVVASESEGYKLLELGMYVGTAGDDFSLNKGMKFSTMDKDNDVYWQNCALESQGGWWHKNCTSVNLNGEYFDSQLDEYKGIRWWSWNDNETLKSVKMLIRPKAK
ncbi:maker62 [Drosophila busckii]|uniref:Maker62 n=1 Tax=Drosophila busckii TaxID=30019 RepID=A0A0M4E950_DROBS|nr:fibrinogen C domain-containing protein 1 [Drosophila busckii]ALC41371.1 maker62 [Drosophila busckii]